MSTRPRRVALISASEVLRRAVRRALRDAPDLALVWDSARGRDALSCLDALSPDVVVIDTYLHDTDPYELTRVLTAQRRLPVLLLDDARDERGLLRAYAAGAAYLVPPPRGASGDRLSLRGLVETVKVLAGSDTQRRALDWSGEAPSTDRPLAAVGIVASAGGPKVLERLLSDLAGGALPPLLLVQHLAPGFQAGFADWLSRVSGYPVSIASDGRPAQRGQLYLGPEGSQFWVNRQGALVVEPTEPGHGFSPSGDRLFERLAAEHGAGAAAVVLSGMGEDGAAGALALHRAGGPVLVQSDAIIDSMPSAAVAAGAAGSVLPLAAIRAWLVEQQEAS